jgi:hypothetical protein
MITGIVLIAGLVVFLVGAVGWRLAYERPFAEAAPLIHADRRRRAWIHRWMLVAMFLTPAGLAGFATRSDVGPVAAMAAAIYALGAVCFIVSLAFRLTVVPWAAERTVVDGGQPYGFAALNSWAGLLYVVHMAASYAAFAGLGIAVVQSATLPPWAGWLGIGWGVVFMAGFVVTRFAGPFNPPFWAHTFTALLGAVLLTR